MLTMSDGAYGPLYAKVAPRRPNSGAIYDNVVPIAKGARKTLQAIDPSSSLFYISITIS